MALQNFFTKTNNFKRATPNQTSGKEMYTEFYMKSEGESKLVVTIIGIEVSKNVISTRVIVRNPFTDEVEFDSDFVGPKK